MGTSGSYKARSVRFLQHADVGEWALKLYGVAPQGRSVRTELADAALGAAQNVLPTPAFGSGRHGVGFVIAHDAPGLCYVLICWWAEENEVHQRVLSAPVDRPGELSPHPSDAVGCVWELSVTDFERRAWIKHVLANPDGPDLKAYRAEEYNDDV